MRDVAVGILEIDLVEGKDERETNLGGMKRNREADWAHLNKLVDEFAKEVVVPGLEHIVGGWGGQGGQGLVYEGQLDAVARELLLQGLVDAAACQAERGGNLCSVRVRVCLRTVLAQLRLRLPKIQSSISSSNQRTSPRGS